MINTRKLFTLPFSSLKHKRSALPTAASGAKQQQQQQQQQAWFSSSIFSSMRKFPLLFFGGGGSSFFTMMISTTAIVAFCNKDSSNDDHDGNNNNNNQQQQRSSSFYTRPSFFVEYEKVAKSAYAVLNADEDYNNIGQVSRDEVEMTVLPNAFTQIGVLEPEGVRELFEIDNPNTCRGLEPVLPRPLNDQDVFIDIGSGVGNINLQVFCETPVRKSIGIELLPSRNSYAELARTVTALFYGDLFLDGARDLEFITSDFISNENKQVVSAFKEATVIFSHSWMFPKELMEKFGDRVLNDCPKLDLIITSRPIPQIHHTKVEDEDGGVGCVWRVMRQAKLQADWNKESPFYIYYKTRKE